MYFFVGVLNKFYIGVRNGEINANVVQKDTSEAKMPDLTRLLVSAVMGSIRQIPEIGFYAESAHAGSMSITCNHSH